MELEGMIKEIPKNQEILSQGKYIKVIPIVLKGLLKVYNPYQEKDLLLYYIQENESCVMSFSSGLKNEPSMVSAVSLQDSTLLLLPIDKVQKWIKEYPEFNTLFFNQYNKRYQDMLSTINHVLFDKLDHRLYDYLKEKARINNSTEIKISHREIASDLGTAREVISRVMKKLENQGFVKQSHQSIKFLGK
jgi:CRP/FNR family transcriptional regulator